QTLSLIASKFGLSGGLWDAVERLNDAFGTLGFVIIGIFIASWLVSMLIYRLMGYDRIEVAEPAPMQPAEWPRQGPSHLHRIAAEAGMTFLHNRHSWYDVSLTSSYRTLYPE